MKKITNIKNRMLKIEKDARCLHKKIFEAFKEIADKKEIKYSVHLKKDFFYSIACGKQSCGFFHYEIFYSGGKIELWEMRFGEFDQKIKEWKTIETFKQDFSSSYLKR